MPKYRKKIWSGDVYEVEEFYCPRTIGKKYERGRNENLTTEEQQKRNLHRARKKLTRIINTNFTGEDYFVLLTYDHEVTEKEAAKEAGNFFRRLKRYRKSNGFSELKYIAVREKQGRIHHHVLLNTFEGLSLKDAQQILQEKWDRGLVLIKRLKKNQPDMKLATYITKESVEEKGAKRWSCSRNLKQPKVKLEQVKQTKRKVSLRPPKNFKVIIQTEDYFEEIGWVRYMKAVREGGIDYGDVNEIERE